VTVELVCYRAAAWLTPLRTRNHGTLGGRFHEPQGRATQYLSLHPLTPWAEVLRNQGITDPDDYADLRIPVWALRVVLPEPPALLDFDAAAVRSDLTPEDLVGDDPAACRRLAATLRADPDAPRVLRVPSAALPGTENLVILEPRRSVEYLQAPRRRQQVPAALTSVRARPPAALAPFVRHRGQAHAGLEAWRRGQAFALPAIEPDRDELHAA